jgi:hypothetical protein
LSVAVLIGSAIAARSFGIGLHSTNIPVERRGEKTYRERPRKRVRSGFEFVVRKIPTLVEKLRRRKPLQPDLALVWRLQFRFDSAYTILTNLNGTVTLSMRKPLR